MNKEELEAFYEKLAELTENGTGHEVREYIEYHYTRLPEDVRKELLFNTLLSAVHEEAREQAALTEMQEKGLAAADTLEDMKAQIGKEGLTE